MTMNEQLLQTEDLERLASDPSLLLTDPELETRLDETLRRAAQGQLPPNDTSAPSAEGAVTTTEGVEDSSQSSQPPPPPLPPRPEESAPAAPLPEFLRDLSEQERATVLEAWLGSMPPQELARIPYVQQVLAQVQAQAMARGELQAQAEDMLAETEGELEEARGLVMDRLARGESVDDALVGFETAAQRYRQMQIAQDISDGFLDVFGRIKLELPPELIRSVENAGTFAEAIRIYGLAIANKGFRDGVAAARAQQQKVAEANAAVLKQKVRAEVMSELQREGRLREGVPPVLAAGTSVGGAELTDEELERYQRLVQQDPLSVPEELERKIEQAYARFLTTEGGRR